MYATVPQPWREPRGRNGNPAWESLFPSADRGAWAARSKCRHRKAPALEAVVRTQGNDFQQTGGAGMTTRLLIAYALITLVLLALALLAGRASLGRRRPRSSQGHLRVDLFDADRGRSVGKPE